MTYVIGCNFFEMLSPNRRFNRMLLFVGFSFCLGLYTVSLDWPNLKKLLKTTMPLSFGIQGSIRLLLLFLNPLPAISIREIIVKYYDQNNTPTANNNLILINRVIKAVSIFYMTCYFGPLLYCFINFFITNSFATSFPIVTPFINPETSLGFAINYSLQIFMSVIMFVGFLSNDGQVTLYLLHMKALVDQFESEVKIFSSKMNQKQLDRCLLYTQMKRIIGSYTEIKEFSLWIKKFYVKPSFAIVVLNTYTICTCGISCVVWHEFNVIGIAMQSFFLLSLVC